MLHMLAASALLGGDAAAGVSYASRLVTALPDSPQARHTLMLARLMANEAMDDSVATDADYQQQFLLGLAAFRDNRFGEALDIARALQGSHPELIDPINLAAAVHLATGDWPQARTEFERVLAMQPD
ncbi:hypothetical protein RZS08_12060, partial [Arthrospira platensis SPKY1]|nr:hypothetical protein [Arthrospira platensis SPKY1]